MNVTKSQVYDMQYKMKLQICSFLLQERKKKLVQLDLASIVDVGLGLDPLHNGLHQP